MRVPPLLLGFLIPFPVHTTSKYRVTLSLTVYTYVASFIRSIPACTGNPGSLCRMCYSLPSIPACTGEPRQSLPNVL